MAFSLADWTRDRRKGHDGRAVLETLVSRVRAASCRCPPPSPKGTVLWNPSKLSTAAAYCCPPSRSDDA
jgi:hypothetical protein